MTKQRVFRYITYHLTIAMLLVSPVFAIDHIDVSGSLGFELRRFVDSPLQPVQLSSSQASVAGEIEFAWQNGDRNRQAGLVPFFRVDDRDQERSHFDIREAYWRYIGEQVEVTLGIDRIFWGVTESRHLVNIINQVDGVENIDEEDYLGQPMLAVALQKDYGRFSAFVLPYFRERTFAGVVGRLRAPLAVNTDQPIFESDDEQNQIDVAIRYSHYLGNWDFGLSVFHGTSREAVLIANAEGSELLPRYDIISQIGLDLQYTGEAWLWKLESIVRKGQGDTFGAFVGGFEYSFYQLGGGDIDLGLIVEYLYDDRDESAPLTILQDDLFIGSRVTLNDTQDTAILAGAIVDLDDQTTALRLEAERRIGQSWRLEIEIQLLTNIDDNNPSSGFANDDFVTLSLKKYF